MDFCLIVFVSLAVLCPHIIFAYSVHECVCVGDQHPQVKFNLAEWVIRATVIEKDYFQCHGDTSYGFPTDPSHQEDDIRYIVSVHEVYKGSVSTTQKLTIVTAASTERCGVPNLEIGKTYFISGKIQDGDYVIDNCDWVSCWSQVTAHQKNSISESRRYADNEMCQSVCPYRREDKLDCYYKYATCVQKIKEVEDTSGSSGGTGTYSGLYLTPSTTYKPIKVCNWVVGYRFEPCLNPVPETTTSVWYVKK